MFNRSALLAIACSLTLAGCDFETKVDLYLSDVLNVAKTGQPEKVTVRYLLEVPTQDKCMLYGPKIVDIIKTQMPEFTGSSCLRRGLSDFIAITGSAPVVRGEPINGGENYSFTYNGISAIGVQVQEDNAAQVSLMMHPSTFADLMARTKQVVGIEYADAKISKIEIILDNDTKKDFKALFKASLIDGDPVIESPATFKARSKRTITVSDVHAKALQRDGSIILFLWLYNKEQ